MEIAIGLILPSSTICRMAKDFEKSFVQELNNKLDGSGYSVELVREFMGNGNRDVLSSTLDKLFTYDQVDIVTGIISNYSLQNMVDKFERFKVPILCNNLGEHMISSAIKNEYVFINSHHYWQQAWLLGYFTAKELGTKGALVSALYDSGYVFYSAFLSGMHAVDQNSSIDIHISPMPNQSELSPIAETMDNIDPEKYDFVLPLFCGSEGTLFLQEYKSRNWGKDIKLVALPFLLEVTSVDLSGISLYTVSHDIEEGSFDIDYNRYFKDLGKVAGKGIGNAILKGKGKIIVKDLDEKLSEIDNSKCFASQESPMLVDPISIFKIDISEGNIYRTSRILSEKVHFENHKDFLKSADNQIASWLNPYLGI